MGNSRDNTSSLCANKVPSTSTHSTNANVSKRSSNGSSSTGSDNACWVFEDPRRTRYCVLTSRGVENIANHKYAPGHYTHLDNLMNPIWVFLTERLIPLWMAPNMVTSLGGLHCALSYFVVRYFSRDYDEPVPDWVILLCAYCSFSCYTLDCMDGKQARRTHQSSPLGQLFDHGMDCVSNISHISNVACFTLLCQAESTIWLFLLQGSLQFSFFMAQWEEYYTGILPHAVGNYCGVTEVNYGVALLTLVNAFIDRENFWKQTLQDVLSFRMELFQNPDLVAWMSTLQLKQVGIMLWVTMIGCLMLSSAYRVFHHVHTPWERMIVLSKLSIPFLLASSPLLFPEDIRRQHVRILSETIALLFFLLTKKMIVFSMAQMSFATLQLHSVPYFLVLLWTRFYHHGSIMNDANSSLLHLVLQIICLFHLYLWLLWCRRAIYQICDRLDINCFTIKHKKV